MVENVIIAIIIPQTIQILNKLPTMSRARKKRKQAPKKRQAEPLVSGNCEELEQKAMSALVSGRYKDASVIYKALLKEERRDAWLSGLGSAYAGRASDLAGKGMFKEALAIWEQRAASCETTLLTSNYIVWTIQAGNIEAALKLYADSQEIKDPQLDRALIAEYFSALALTGETRILELLPADHPVVRDHAAANALLMAFCNSEAAALETGLKAISFRSPYRDFRQLIKAWVLGEQTPKDFSAAVSRIGKHSPFSGLANALLELYVPEYEAGTSEHQKEMTSTLKMAINGWSLKQVGFLKAAEALEPEPNAKALFSLLMRFTQAFDKPVARSAALNLLIHYPQGKQVFNRYFGKPSSFEQAKLNAQMLDMEGDPYQSDMAWREVLEELDILREPGTDRLREALVLRKLADRWLVLESDFFTLPKVIEDLSDSLLLDPDDIATHAKLIDLQRKNNDLKGARASVTDALKCFPENTAILIEAVQTAIAGNAFKKAANIAQKILKLDPINIKVQGILLDAHLSHGRKQIKTKKFDLARREILEAAKWARTPETQGKVKLVSGLLEYSAKETVYGQGLLKEGVELCGGALVGQYQLLIEAQKLNLQRQDWLKITALPKANTYTSREHIMALIRAIGSTQGLEDDDIHGALLQFDAAIRASIKEPYTQQETELICDTLLKYGFMRLLEKFAQQALKQWPEQAVFDFYALYAKVDGSSYKLSERQCDRMDSAFVKARDSGDSRTAHRIVEFMNPPSPFGPSFGPAFGGGLPFPPDMLDDLPAEIAAMLKEADPDDVEAFLEMMERDFGEHMDDDPPRKKGSKSNQKDLF